MNIVLTPKKKNRDGGYDGRGDGGVNWAEAVSVIAICLTVVAIYRIKKKG